MIRILIVMNSFSVLLYLSWTFSDRLQPKLEKHLLPSSRMEVISMKLACLSRLKSVFREPQAGHEFHEWGIPLLVREISIAARLTSVVVDILYENTMDVREVECLIQNLKENKECVEVLTRLDEARLLIYRLISTGDGFALFDELGDYLTNEFKSFMVMTKIEGNLVDVSYL